MSFIKICSQLNDVLFTIANKIAMINTKNQTMIKTP